MGTVDGTLLIGSSSATATRSSLSSTLNVVGIVVLIILEIWWMLAQAQITRTVGGRPLSLIASVARKAPVAPLPLASCHRCHVDRRFQRLPLGLQSIESALNDHGSGLLGSSLD